MKGRLASILAATAGLILVASSTTLAPTVTAQAASAPVVKAAATKKPAAIQVTEKFKENDYILGFKWNSKNISSAAVYSLKISIDGSSYKTVDKWGGKYSEARFTRNLKPYFPKLAAGFRGKAVVSYELNGQQSEDSVPLSFTGSGNGYNLSWIG